MEGRIKQDHDQAEYVYRPSEGFEALVAKVEELVIKNSDLGRQLSDLQAQYKRTRLTNLNAVAERHLEIQIGAVDVQPAHSTKSSDGYRQHESVSSTEVYPTQITCTGHNDEKVLAAKDALNNLSARNNVIMPTETQVSSVSVNMIQDLGLKEQPMLVPIDHEEAALQDQSSKDKVERWATVCTESMEEGVELDESSDNISHPRSGHFDRPLKDV
ncbi:hypothetical protein MMC26_000508 [Xylographa opegraphella]|nr:hypothetical protein [Xylographa opegraphella]